MSGNECRAFRRHSATLLNAIDSPDQFAWHLFSAGLISSTLRDEVLVPMLTRLQKNSVLLSAIEGKIKAEPLIFHQFVQLLQESDDSAVRSVIGRMKTTLVGQIDIPKEEPQPIHGASSSAQSSLHTNPPSSHSTQGGYQRTAQDVPPTSTGTSECLTLVHLFTLLEELKPIRAEWYNFGLGLSLGVEDLDAIRTRSCDPLESLREVLKVWLERTTPSPTWQAVVDVLTSPVIDKQTLAAELKEKFCYSR